MGVKTLEELRLLRSRGPGYHPGSVRRRRMARGRLDDRAEDAASDRAAAGGDRGKQGVWAEFEPQRMKYPLNQLFHFGSLLPETSSNFPIAPVSTASTSGAT